MMAAAARLVVSPLKGCEYSAVAARLVDHARALGLRASMRHCRKAGSTTRYVDVIDTVDQVWLIRLSRFNRHPDTFGDRPQRDIVFIDPEYGFRRGADFLDAVSLLMVQHTVAQRLRQPRPRR